MRLVKTRPLFRLIPGGRDAPKESAPADLIAFLKEEVIDILKEWFVGSYTLLDSGGRQYKVTHVSSDNYSIVIEALAAGDPSKVCGRFRIQVSIVDDTEDTSGSNRLNY